MFYFLNHYTLGLKIIFDYPWWYILLCLLAGAIYSLILYRKNKRESFPVWLNTLLGTVRFLAVFFISFLLLSPMIRQRKNEVEKPIIVLAHDNSSSVISVPDSLFFREEYKTILDETIRQLNEGYDLKFFSFGETIKEDWPDSMRYDEKVSDLSQVFAEVANRYANRNVGALIFASDGIYNRGMNPLYQIENLPYPVYTVALGDTIRYKDLLIKELKHNRIAFLGNAFPVNVNIEALEAQGQKAIVSISKDSRVLAREERIISDDNFFVSVPFQLEASSVGIQRYHVEVAVVEGEKGISNNVQDFFVEVIDSRQKILILAQSPHPDLGALKMSLDANDNYETELSFIDNFKGNISDYNLVVLHQLPSDRNSVKSILAEIVKNQTAVFLIVGAQTDVNALPGLFPGLDFNLRSNNFNESFAIINNAFPLFSLQSGTIDALEAFPPLYTKFGNWRFPANTFTLINQKIGSVATEQPLMFFTNSQACKIGVLGGEGIWRWRLTDFLRNNNHQVFQEWLFKTIQYLAVDEEKTPFKVKTQSSFNENENVIFDAQVYNPSFELINQPEVSLIVSDEGGRSYSYVFSRTADSYTLNAGGFLPGLYSYKAQVKMDSRILTALGQFSVSALNLEEIRTIANHRLLYQIANKTGGQMVYPEKVSLLPEMLQAREDIRPVIYQQKRFDDLISFKWLFGIIIGLFALEWFMRKYFGSY